MCLFGKAALTILALLPNSLSLTFNPDPKCGFNLPSGLTPTCPTGLSVVGRPQGTKNCEALTPWPCAVWEAEHHNPCITHTAPHTWEQTSDSAQNVQVRHKRPSSIDRLALSKLARGWQKWMLQTTVQVSHQASG